MNFYPGWQSGKRVHVMGDISIYTSMRKSYFRAEFTSKSFFPYIQTYSDNNARGILCAYTQYTVRTYAGSTP